MRAINLVNGTLRDELPPVRSVDELRRSRAHLEALGLGVGRDGILAASLAHFEELQAPVPTSTAEDVFGSASGPELSALAPGMGTVVGISMEIQMDIPMGIPMVCPWVL